MQTILVRKVSQMEHFHNKFEYFYSDRYSKIIKYLIDYKIRRNAL